MRNLSVSAILKRLVRNPEALTRERVKALIVLAQSGHLTRRFLELLVKSPDGSRETDLPR